MILNYIFGLNKTSYHFFPHSSTTLPPLLASIFLHEYIHLNGVVWITCNLQKCSAEVSKNIFKGPVPHYLKFSIKMSIDLSSLHEGLMLN